MGIKEDIVQTTASRITTGGGSIAVFGGLTANEVAAFGGLAVAVLGLIYQVYRGQQNAKILREKEKP